MLDKLKWARLCSSNAYKQRSVFNLIEDSWGSWKFRFRAESRNISVRTSRERFRVADKRSLSLPQRQACFWCKREISPSIFSIASIVRARLIGGEVWVANCGNRCIHKSSGWYIGPWIGWIVSGWDENALDAKMHYIFCLYRHKRAYMEMAIDLFSHRIFFKLTISYLHHPNRLCAHQVTWLFPTNYHPKNETCSDQLVCCLLCTWQLFWFFGFFFHLFVDLYNSHALPPVREGLTSLLWVCPSSN